MSDYDYRKYPRPNADYYHLKHDWLSQGTIVENSPTSVLGPFIVQIDPPPAELPTPEKHVPAITYVFTWGWGIIVSNTCDFRLPRVRDLEQRPREFPEGPYRGYVRVAPVAPLHSVTEIPEDEYDSLRQFDKFRRFIYLPELVQRDTGEEILPESVVLLNLTDVLHVDLVRRLSVVAQLTYEARRQLSRKLVFHATGSPSELEPWDPDME